MMLLVLVLLAGSVAAQTSNEGRQFLCGRELARAHSIYCYGVDPIPEETDRASKKVPILEKNTVGIEIPGRFTHKLRRSVQASHDKFMNSLVETCCLNPCAVSDLLNHC